MCQSVWVTDLSVFQDGDGLGRACTVRVSRLFWASTADVVELCWALAAPGYEGATSSCLMK